jgi:hypothetical protein
MIRPADPRAWLEYKRRLPGGRELDTLPLPTDLPYRGVLRKSFNYVPPDSVLEALSRWMSGRKETDLLYFLTEYIGAEPTDYVISRSSLTEAELSAINNARQNVFVGVNGDWAVFMDHDGGLHVAGPAELYEVLNAASGMFTNSQMRFVCLPGGGPATWTGGSE